MLEANEASICSNWVDEVCNDISALAISFKQLSPWDESCTSISYFYII